MSYNITAFRVKKQNLTFAIADLLEACNHLQYARLVLFNGGVWQLDANLSEGYILQGRRDDMNVLSVTEITTYSDGSGNSWDDFLDILRRSKGRLEALVVWEGGDSISTLTVDDGVVSQGDVDL